MNLPAAQLLTYRDGMRLAKTVRHLCESCNDLNDDGTPYGPCARHRGVCMACESTDIAVRDFVDYEDGVPGWFCEPCAKALEMIPEDPEAQGRCERALEDMPDRKDVEF